VIVAVVPFVTPADIAVQAVGIDAEGVGMVLAIHIARDGIAQEPAQKHAADDGAAIAVAHGRADQAAADGAEDRSGRGVAVVAGALIVAFAIICGRSGRRTVAVIAAIISTIVGEMVILAVAIIIAVVIHLAVIAVRIGSWRGAVILGHSRGRAEREHRSRRHQNLLHCEISWLSCSR
jgi:hypothetical protein